MEGKIMETEGEMEVYGRVGYRIGRGGDGRQYWGDGREDILCSGMERWRAHSLGPGIGWSRVQGVAEKGRLSFILNQGLL